MPSRVGPPPLPPPPGARHANTHLLPLRHIVEREFLRTAQERRAPARPAHRISATDGVSGRVFGDGEFGGGRGGGVAGVEFGRGRVDASGDGSGGDGTNFSQMFSSMGEAAQRRFRAFAANFRRGVGMTGADGARSAEYAPLPLREAGAAADACDDVGTEMVPMRGADSRLDSADEAVDAGAVPPLPAVPAPRPLYEAEAEVPPQRQLPQRPPR